MNHPKELLFQLGAAARKSLSQSFLTSVYWAEVLTKVALEEKRASEIWEVGPGLGALTTLLTQKSPCPMKVFEYDRKLAAYLRAQFPKLEVIEGDFLEVDLNEISSGTNKIVVISNLPYHLSSPIFFKLLEQKHRFLRLVLTFQEEFADRLIAQPRTPAYSGLSVLAQTYFKMGSLGILPPGAFYPKPAISSQALILEPKSDVAIPIEKLSPVVKAAFKHRRKKLIRNLKEAFPKAPLDTLFQWLQISEMARPEELSPEIYTRLTQRIFEV